MRMDICYKVDPPPPPDHFPNASLDSGEGDRSTFGMVLVLEVDHWPCITMRDYNAVLCQMVESYISFRQNSNRFYQIVHEFLPYVILLQNIT